MSIKPFSAFSRTISNPKEETTTSLTKKTNDIRIDEVVDIDKNLELYNKNN